LQRAAGDFYVYVYIQIRVLGRIMMNVTGLLFERTEPDTQILRVSAVYRTMESKKKIFRFVDLKNAGSKIPVCKNRTGGKELSFNW
jgi:hypothetical protein